MTVDDFESAALGIVRRLRRHRRTNPIASAWDSVVSDFAARGSCDVDLLEVLEQEVAGYLRALRVGALRAVWTTSNLGVGDADDADLIPISELRRLLEPELLSRITELATAEAHDVRS